MNTRTFLVVIGVSALALVVVFLIIASQKNKSTTPVDQTTNQTSQQSVKSNPTPVASAISKPVPVVTRTLRGTAASVNQNSLSLTVSGKTEVLNLATTNDVYKLTGGTIEGGNAKTQPAKVSDIKAGQELLVIADKNSPNVQRVVILK